MQRFDGAGDKCFLELEDEEQTDESELDLRDPGPKYGARCVYEEVKAAVEKKWDTLEGTEGVEGMGWCPHPGNICSLVCLFHFYTRSLLTKR